MGGWVGGTYIVIQRVDHGHKVVIPPGMEDRPNPPTHPPIPRLTVAHSNRLLLLYQSSTVFTHPPTHPPTYIVIQRVDH